jgi:hypothetical protein
MRGSSRRAWWQVALAVAFVLSAAAVVPAQDVTYNAMPGTDFSKFKTYKWVAIEGVKYPDQITDSQIKAAIDKQLAGKGFTKTDADTADLFVTYQLALQEQKEWNVYGTGGYRYRGMGGTGTATSSTILIGTLGVDMYTPAEKQLVWRGSATRTVDPNAKPEKRTQNLDKAMTKMFKNYPPPVKK